MTQDAAHEMQVRIVTALKASADVAALVGNRIYDRVPMTDGKITATFPYISFGPVHSLSLVHSLWHVHIGSPPGPPQPQR